MKRQFCFLLCILMALSLLGYGAEEQLSIRPDRESRRSTESRLPEPTAPETTQAAEPDLSGQWTLNFTFADGKDSFAYPSTVDAGAGTLTVTLDSGDSLVSQLTLFENSEMVLWDGASEVYCGTYAMDGDTLRLEVTEYGTARKDRLENMPETFWQAFEMQNPSHTLYLRNATDFSEGLAWIEVVYALPQRLP